MISGLWGSGGFSQAFSGTNGKALGAEHGIAGSRCAHTGGGWKGARGTRCFRGRSRRGPACLCAGGTPPWWQTQPPRYGAGQGGQEQREAGGAALTWALGDVAGSPLGDPGSALDVAPGRGVAVRVPAAVVVLIDCQRAASRQRGSGTLRSPESPPSVPRARTHLRGARRRGRSAPSASWGTGRRRRPLAGCRGRTRRCRGGTLRRDERALRAARAAPAAPGRSPARPPPSPQGCLPSRDRPLSPTKPGRHSPSAPRAAPSSSEPSRSRARSILGAEGEEPPPARPRSSAPLGETCPGAPLPVNKRRAALPPPPRSRRRVLTLPLPPPAPGRGRGGCCGQGSGQDGTCCRTGSFTPAPSTAMGAMGARRPGAVWLERNSASLGLPLTVAEKVWDQKRRLSTRNYAWTPPVARKVFIFRDLKLLPPLENYHEGLNPAALIFPLDSLSSEETLWAVHTAIEAVHLHLKGVYILASANPLLSIDSMYLL